MPVIAIAIWFALIVGWIANLVQVIGMASGDVTALFILKLAGIFAGPLGSILGLIGFFQ